jgi:hypothetical protein
VRELDADGIGLFLVARFLRVEQTQEEDPCQFGHILECAGTVGPAHHVADALDEGAERLRRRDGLGFLFFLGACHGHISKAEARMR